MKDRGKYLARFKGAGERVSIGTYDTAVEAAVAYARRVKEVDDAMPRDAAGEVVTPEVPNPYLPCPALTCPDLP